MLLFDEELESFRVYNGGAQPTTPTSKTPTNGRAQQTTPTSEKEEDESPVDKVIHTNLDVQ